MSAAFDAGNGKITVPDIVCRKTSIPSRSDQCSEQCSLKSESGRRKIVCLTAYDYPTARLMDEAGVDIVLVGDSLGMVVLGYENTLPVTLDEMLHHTTRSAARRAAGAARRGHALRQLSRGSDRSRCATRCAS